MIPLFPPSSIFGHLEFTRRFWEGTIQRHSPAGDFGPLFPKNSPQQSYPKTCIVASLCLASLRDKSPKPSLFLRLARAHQT